MAVKIFAVAGEPSGDRILGRLLQGLRAYFPNLEVTGLGGPFCAAQGLESLAPFDRLAVHGVGDVLRNLPFLYGVYADIRRALRRFDPGLVLLVDYPGMNLGLTRRAAAQGYHVHYVSPPQLWAYRNPEHRLRRLRAALQKSSLQILFPFERDVYAPWAQRLAIGHFFDAPAPAKTQGGRLLLCPGSRRATLRRNLPLWLEKLRAQENSPLLRNFSGIDVLSPPYLAAEAKILCRDLDRNFPVEMITDPFTAWDRAAAAIAFPGTITLELFLRRIPCQVWAILDPLTLRAGKRTLRFPWVSLPNLVLQKTVYPEWVGTAGGFRRSDAGLKAKWQKILEPDLNDVWEKIGMPNGDVIGITACLELLESHGSKIAE